MAQQRSRPRRQAGHRAEGRRGGSKSARSGGALADSNGSPQGIYQHLRGLIVRGQLGPGSRLVELEIAARLGVSRTPVRAALHRLLQEGYIAASPSLRQARLAVAPLTREDAREVLNILGSLEGVAAREAAALDRPSRQALAARMKELNAELRRISDPTHPDPNRLHDVDAAFHRQFVDAGGPRLRALHGVIWPQAERYAWIYAGVFGEQTHSSVGEHDAIARAIRDGNPDAAQLAVETNWRNAAERLARVIETVGERGRW
jgi:DNA-binding GntR family transcriptional regulator